MKKKIVLPFLLLIGMLCLSACSNTSEEQQSSDSVNQEEQNDPKEEEQDEEEPITEQEEPKVEEDNTTDQAPVEEPVNIMIYYSNADASALDSEEVQIRSLSPDEVLKALIDKGAVAADVETVSFKITSVDDKATIELDFNSEFASYVSSMGSTGEYYVMGSVCNTFLDAYDCEQIKITVKGKPLSTGHAEYPGYMTKFS